MSCLNSKSRRVLRQFTLHSFSLSQWTKLLRGRTGSPGEGHSPFEPENQFHLRAWHPAWHLKAPVAGIRAELMRRGLPQYGYKQEFHDRLIANNRLVLTMDGKYELHKRRLAVMEAQKTEIVPFQQFPHLPPEVRLIIWECSLPGPRVLSVSDCRK